MFQWLEFGVYDVKPCSFAEAFPFRRSEESSVAWVAEFFDLVNPCLGGGFVVRHAAIDEEEMAARFKHAGGFLEKGFRVAEVVSGHTAGHE